MKITSFSNYLEGAIEPELTALRLRLNSRQKRRLRVKGQGLGREGRRVVMVVRVVVGGRRVGRDGLHAHSSVALQVL